MTANETLRQQIDNPEHCHLRINGAFLCHRPNRPQEEQNPLAGTPIRFTKLAATNTAKNMSGFGRTIDLVPIKVSLLGENFV